MTFAISDDLLPAILTSGPITDQDFALSADHPDLRFETTEGDMIVMAPNSSLASVQGANLTAELNLWS